MDRKISHIWSFSDEKFRDICENAHTFSEIARMVGLNPQGANFNTIRRRAKHDNVDLNHITTGLGSTKNKSFPEKAKRAEVPNEQLFVENSPHLRTVARRRIIKYNLLPYVCKECNQEPFWKGKPLSLVLDHENGINNDHRLENLRFLCPNCNSQTDTFCGRNLKYTLPEGLQGVVT